MAINCAPNCNADYLAAQALANQRLLGFIILAVAVVAVTAVILIIRHRRKIARTLDEATVSTLATGLKASRSFSEKAKSYGQRIADRADER